MVFINVEFSREQREGDDTSCFNDIESNLVCNFLNRFCKKFSNLLDSNSKNLIGVISPYKKQVYKIKNQI